MTLLMPRNMEDYGLFRVAAAVPRVKVADVDHNTKTICRMIDQAEARQASLVVFPELSVTAYTCADLFGQDLLLRKAEEGVAKIMAWTRGKAVTVIVGTPVQYCGKLYNCAAVIRNGGLKGLVPKIYLPTYGEFYEARWFSSGSDFLSQLNVASGHFVNDGKRFSREGFDSEISFAGQQCNISPNLLFTIGHATLGIEICEDFWAPVPPSSFLAPSGAEIIVNLSASNEVMTKYTERKMLIANQSGRTESGYIYCSSGFGESTQDMVYAGSSIICESGSILAENERFQIVDSMIFADLDIQKLDTLRQKKNSFRGMAPDGTGASEYSVYYSRYDLGPAAETDFSKELLREVEPHPFLPEGNPAEVADRSREILSIQTIGLATRLEHIGCKTAVVGISGGLDSTLALLVTVMAFDKLGLPRKGIWGITMPGLGTTKRTKSNATDLMKALGITMKEISVVPAVNQHFKDIGHDPKVLDSTYENAQARERTQILMDIANQEGGIVIGTGDLSELALGWCTYNGDHMSMYAVNSSVPKTLIKHLVRWAAENVFTEKAKKGQRSASEILMDVLDTPISPELKPASSKGEIKQKTEDLIGPYELHDFFLYNFLRYGWSPKKIYFFAKIAFAGVYDAETILKWLKKFYWRFFSQQFKRSCLPDGPKITIVTLSPRGDWRMPSDAKVKLWMDELDKLG
jgi:NAD+ synthase (glutamine-hydrolysing)